MTAMRTCKKCNNTYAASAFATRTGFICKWCKPDAEAIRKELDIANMKLIAVGHALQGIGGETHPSFRSLELEDALRLRAERDAAAKDAERYRWLKKENRSTYPSTTSACVTFNIGHDWVKESDLDAAIDAAKGEA